MTGERIGYQRNMSRRHARSRGSVYSAFTLLEILLVLGLLVILTGLAWPALESQILASSLPESADRVRNLLSMVKAEAAMQHRPCRIRFEPGEQQPYIEVEVDPILRSGEWEPVTSTWARDPILLEGVNVNEIRPGRPVFTEPLSEDIDPVQEHKARQKALEESRATSESTAEADATQADVDEKRPLIIFEADGSTGWATLIVSKQPLEEELDEDAEQMWVILDGRTGIAVTQAKMSDEDLANPDLYVLREKLEMPQDLDASDLSFTINNGVPGSEGDRGNPTMNLGGTGAPGGATGGVGGRGGQTPDLGDLGDMADDAMNGGRGAGAAGGGRGPQAGGGRGSAGRPTAGRDGGRVNRGPGGRGGDTGDLNDKLGGSNDLNDQERDNIRKTLGRGGNGGGRGGQPRGR